MRCLDRTDHETLNNQDPSLLARVQVSFFKSYKGLTFTPNSDACKHFLSINGLDDIIRVPLTLEHPDLELPYNLQVCLDKCLKLTNSGAMGPAQPHEEFDRLVQLANMYKSFFNGVTKFTGVVGGIKEG